MGRGLGKVQRAIIERLERDGYVIPRDIDEFAQPSVARAVTSLIDRDLIGVWYCNLHTRCVYPDWITGERKKQDSYRYCAVVVPPETSSEEFRVVREEHGLWP